MKIAVIQYSIANIDDIKAKGLSLIQEALKEKPSFIVLPEIFTTPYFPQFRDDSSFNYAEPIPGPTTEAIESILKDTDTTVIASIYEKGENGSYYCSAAVINSSSGYLGKYRKLHIPTSEGIHEDYFFTPGNLGHVVFQTPHASIAVMLCYDRHFTESARIYGLRDIDILFIASATPVSAKNIWFTEMQAHAYANGYYLACANRTGKEDAITFLGSSFICDYRGEIITRLAEAEEILIADINIPAGRDHRHNLSFWRDRRPDQYGEIIEDIED